MVDPRGDVESWTDLVAALDVSGKSAERRVDGRRAHRRHFPLAEDGLGSDEVVRVRVLDVAAKRGLGEGAVVAVADRASGRRARDEGTTRRRRTDQQAGERVH